MSTLFPVPTPPGEPGPCAWCGAPAVERVEVTPLIFTSVGGVRRLKMHAVEADVCAEHALMVARNKAEREAEAEERARKRRAAQ